jgi:hypothetical protein
LVLEEAQGHLLTTRAVFEAEGRDWEEDKAGGGTDAATLRKVLKRLVMLGLVESQLAGNERTYRAISPSSSSYSSSIEDEPEGGEYESPERMADTREERIPQHVREERDADQLWESQHRQRTKREAELLERQAAEDDPATPPPLLTLEERRLEPPLPEVGEVVEITNCRGGWSPGYRVTKAEPGLITLTSEATGRTVDKTPSVSRPPWRRSDSSQHQNFLLTG